MILETLLLLLPLACKGTTAAAATDDAQSGSAAVVAVPMKQSSYGPVFNLTVGTPPQPLTVLSDWTWMSFFTRSAYCDGSYNVSNCIPAGQGWFDDHASSTFQNSTSYAPTGWANTAFLPGEDFNVTYASDVVCLEASSDAAAGDSSQSCTPATVFQLSDFDVALTSALPFAGIFGLSPVLPGSNASFYPASYQAYLNDTLAGALVGYHSCANLASSSSCAGGDMLTVFGGTANSSVFDPSSVAYLDVETEPCITISAPLDFRPARDNFWSLRWTGFWIGDQAVDLNISSSSSSSSKSTSSSSPACTDSSPLAVLDEGSEGVGAPVPSSAYDALVAAANATVAANQSVALNTGNQTYYTVPCAAISTLPTLTYELGAAQNYTIAPAQYVVSVPPTTTTTTTDGTAPTNTCYLNAKTWALGPDAPAAFFGSTFFGNLYVVFDFEGLRVGLAPLNQQLFS
ncbi:MAG: hypothetical protein M1819_005818 [Sarea resinae]|nr:MAG: hypothetical protein M1819_005818 [Sarea resinae]